MVAVFVGHGIFPARTLIGIAVTTANAIMSTSSESSGEIIQNPTKVDRFVSGSLRRSQIINAA